jgi:hypothetical protein
MVKGSTPFLLTEMMETQHLEMGEAAAVLKKLDGSDQEGLLQFQTLALQSEGMAEELELRFETMETSQMEMVEALIAWQLKQAGLAREVL